MNGPEIDHIGHGDPRMKICLQITFNSSLIQLSLFAPGGRAETVDDGAGAVADRDEPLRTSVRTPACSFVAVS